MDMFRTSRGISNEMKQINGSFDEKRYCYVFIPENLKIERKIKL
jgi:hypothetical protein